MEARSPMKTDELIQSLSGNLAAVPPGAVARRIARGLGLGALGSAGVMLAWLGLRPDLAQAISTPMFWMKFGYSALTGPFLALVLTRLAKPAARPRALVALAEVEVVPLSTRRQGRARPGHPYAPEVGDLPAFPVRMGPRDKPGDDERRNSGEGSQAFGNGLLT